MSKIWREGEAKRYIWWVILAFITSGASVEDFAGALADDDGFRCFYFGRITDQVGIDNPKASAGEFARGVVDAKSRFGSIADPGAGEHFFEDELRGAAAGGGGRDFGM